MRKYIFSIAVGLIISTIVMWVGCSNSDTAFSPTTETDPEISTYFPLTAGTSKQFVEVNKSVNDTSYHWFTISDPVIIGGRQVFRWIDDIVERPTFVDTGFLFYDNEAIYYFESPYETPEKLLTSPFEVGSVWLRYDASAVQLEYDNLIDIFSDYTYDKNNDDGVQGGFFDGGDPYSNDGAKAGKCFPTLGANYFKITAIEDISLDNGNNFEDCLRIENNLGGSINYYWYSPGVGLVKYAIGADSENYPEGEIVGQIVLSKSNR